MAERPVWFAWGAVAPRFSAALVPTSVAQAAAPGAAAPFRMAGSETLAASEPAGSAAAGSAAADSVQKPEPPPIPKQLPTEWIQSCASALVLGCALVSVALLQLTIPHRAFNVIQLCFLPLPLRAAERPYTFKMNGVPFFNRPGRL